MNASFAHLPSEAVALNIPALERDGDMEAGEPSESVLTLNVHPMELHIESTHA